jgi:Predicted integral membrane protein
VTNLYSDEVGNPQLPKKFQTLQKHRSRVRWTQVAIALLVLGAIAAAFLFVLRTPTRSTLSVAEKSIAVLPFENLSRDPDNAYSAIGIQDEILTRLAKITALKVISRTSTQQYAARPADLSEIGRQLHVAHILEGSVQKAGDQVHVNAQLIRAATNEHLWAESYDRKLENIFGVEAEIATAVAGALKRETQRY